METIPNELMIGDWVVYKGDTEYDNPIKIEGMDIATDALITSDREDVGFNGVEPIPLTTEILNKNFRADKQWDCGWFVNDHIHIYQTNSGVYNIQYMEIVDIQYVHELQHAFRLCGFEKEIQL